MQMDELFKMRECIPVGEARACKTSEVKVKMAAILSVTQTTIRRNLFLLVCCYPDIAFEKRGTSYYWWRISVDRT